MAQPVMQKSFHAGEWAPTLNARVDLAKYHSAAALMRNFFVDYRGGASSRTGTKYVLQAYNSAYPVRLIGFQASFTIGYILEFGQNYIRFYYNGAPVLEAAKTITGATQATPAVLAIASHGYSIGDWIYVSTVVGMTQLNGNYYRINSVPDANHVGLGAILNSANINSSAYTAYSSGGTAQRVYTLPSPYAASDLALLKFAGNINRMVLTHPSYVPYVLNLISASSWTLSVIQFGTTLAAPTGMGIATTAAGGWNYSYVVTAVDVNGQESLVSAIVSSTVTPAVGISLTVSWTAVSGAISYNVYRAGPSTAAAVVPVGSAFGFVQNVTGTSFADTFANGISAYSIDYSQTPQISQNPFQGAGVASITVTAAGTYTTVPGLTVGAAPAGGHTATASAVLQVQGTPAVSGAGGTGFAIGDSVTFSNGVVLIVATLVPATSRIATFQPITFPGSNPGSVTGTGASTPTNPVAQVATSGGGSSAAATLTWGVGLAVVNTAGDGYATAPAVTPSAGGATFTASLGTGSSGNPSVPVFYDQRLMLAGPPNNPHQFNLSITGNYYNFNVSYPRQADDAIQGTLVATKLNSIKSLIPMPTGLIALSDQQAWLINGGGNNPAVSPINITANSHSYNGASDVPPIVANFDILYVQAKGSIIRDLTYNFYTAIFTGTDISVLSSHLFYGYTITEWAWAEEPFKLVYAVRNDGTMLTLTFLKEQELIGWAHSDTDIGNGLGTSYGDFKSVATVTETITNFGAVDAVYTVVQRTINGNSIQYIERFAERYFPNGADDVWCVDAGLQYSGAPATSFTGGQHLAGARVTGVADGLVITPFTMAATGNFTLGTAASKVTIGLAFVPQLKTLAIDTGEPTIQSKVKKIPGVTIRVADTLGLSIGSDFDHLVAMKDLVIGEVSGMLTGQASQLVTDLVTGDAYTIIDPTYTVPGQYCIQQSNPFPATILGVIPELTVGDTPR